VRRWCRGTTGRHSAALEVGHRRLPLLRRVRSACRLDRRAPGRAAPSGSAGVGGTARGACKQLLKQAWERRLLVTGDAVGLDMTSVRAAAEDQGWMVGTNAQGDVLYYPPSSASRAVYGSGAPDDRRTCRNLVAQLRLQGFLWPWAQTATRATGHSWDVATTSRDVSGRPWDDSRHPSANQGGLIVSGGPPFVGPPAV
jgi:hypothetical protein